MFVWNHVLLQFYTIQNTLTSCLPGLDVSRVASLVYCDLSTDSTQPFSPQFNDDAYKIIVERSKAMEVCDVRTRLWCPGASIYLDGWGKGMARCLEWPRCDSRQKHISTRCVHTEAVSIIHRWTLLTSTMSCPPSPPHPRTLYPSPLWT